MRLNVNWTQSYNTGGHATHSRPLFTLLVHLRQRNRTIFRLKMKVSPQRNPTSIYIYIRYYTQIIIVCQSLVTENLSHFIQPIVSNSPQQLLVDFTVDCHQSTDFCQVESSYLVAFDTGQKSSSLLSNPRSTFAC